MTDSSFQAAELILQAQKAAALLLEAEACLRDAQQQI
jgi:hypothetical protein